MDFIWSANSLRFEIYFPGNWVRQYFLALYTSFYLFGVGEVVPQTSLETILAVFVLLIFAVVNNLVLGVFSIYAEELSHKAAILQKKIDLTNTAMSNLVLPKQLR